MNEQQDQIELTEAQAEKIEGSTFQLVQREAGASYFEGFESVFAGMGVRGFECTGIRDDEHSRNLREELKGMPVFSGLCGPMWNGYTEDGRPCIRYEDPKAYATYSA